MFRDAKQRMWETLRKTGISDKALARREHKGKSRIMPLPTIHGLTLHAKLVHLHLKFLTNRSSVNSGGTSPASDKGYVKHTPGLVSGGDARGHGSYASFTSAVM